MKKNKWKLPAAGLAALALLLGLYGILRATNAEKEEGETEGEALTAMVSEDITELAVTVDGQEAVFVREDSEWKKSGEDGFPVNKDKLDTLAETFSGLTADRELSDIEDLSEYGLDSPASTVSLTDAEGETVSFGIGDENSSNGKYYVNLNGSDTTVYLVDESFSSILPDTVMDLAQSEDFPQFTSSDVTGVEISSGNGEILLSKQDDSVNWLVNDGSGKEYSAEYQNVSSLNGSLAGFAFMQLEAYDVEDFSIYGLDEPSAVITVHYEEEVEEETEEDSGENTDSSSAASESEEEEEPETVPREVTIYVGGQNEDGNYYVRVGESSQVQLVLEDSITEIIGKTAKDYWDISLGYISLSDIQQAEVSYGGNTVVIQRVEEESTDEDGDTVTSVSYTCSGEELDKDTVEQFFNAYNGMEAQTKDMALTTENGVEMTIVFQTEDGEKKMTLAPYNENFYLGADTEGRPGLVNKNKAAELFEKFEAIFAQTEE
jgi:hypothetical protein